MYVTIPNGCYVGYNFIEHVSRVDQYEWISTNGFNLSSQKASSALDICS